MKQCHALSNDRDCILSYFVTRSAVDRYPKTRKSGGQLLILLGYGRYTKVMYATDMSMKKRMSLTKLACLLNDRQFWSLYTGYFLRIFFTSSTASKKR